MDLYAVLYPESEGSELSEPNLKPCPFCGCKPTITGQFPQGQYYIKCDNCRASMWYDRRDKVIDMWNRRTK